MRAIRNFIAAVLLVACASHVAAQQTDGYHRYPHAFIGVQGGVQGLLSSDYKLGKILTPDVALSVGTQINNNVGARLSVSGWQGKNGLQSTDDRYKFNSINANIDLMLNMSNILTGRKYSRFNVYLLGGVGMNYEWNNGALNVTGATEDMTNMWSENQLNHNFRVGTQLAIDLCRYVDFNVEAGAYAIGDRYESVYNGRYDWQGYLMAGFTFKFGHKKRVVEQPREVAPIEPVEESVPAAIVRPNPRPTPPTKVVQLDKPKIERSIYFEINQTKVAESEMAKVDELVDFMQKNPTANLFMSGYADKMTGTAKVNAKIARLRVQNVVELITSRGIEVTRIFTNSLGDTVQPYTDNSQNRVVIAVGY